MTPFHILPDSRGVWQPNRQPDFVGNLKAAAQVTTIALHDYPFVGSVWAMTLREFLNEFSDLRVDPPKNILVRNCSNKCYVWSVKRFYDCECVKPGHPSGTREDYKCPRGCDGGVLPCTSCTDGTESFKILGKIEMIELGQLTEPMVDDYSTARNLVVEFGDLETWLCISPVEKSEP